MEISLDIIRTAVAVTLALSGLSKLTTWFGFGGVTETAAGFRMLGLRGGRLAVIGAGASQLGAGLFLLIGLLTPLAGMMAVGVMVVASTTQLPRGFWAQRGGVEYPLLLTLLSAALIWATPSSWSLDRLLGLTYPLALLAVATAAGLLGGIAAYSVLRSHNPITD